MRAEQQSDMQGRIRGVYDKHKGRYGYRRIMATLGKLCITQPTAEL